MKTTTTGSGERGIETLTITGFGGFCVPLVTLLDGEGVAEGEGEAEAVVEVDEAAVAAGVERGVEDGDGGPGWEPTAGVCAGTGDEVRGSELIGDGFP